MNRTRTVVVVVVFVALLLGSVSAWWASAQSVYHECLARKAGRTDLVETIVAARDESLRQGTDPKNVNIVFANRLIEGLPPVECSEPLELF